MADKNKGKHLRDASLSSYLAAEEEEYVPKLAESIQFPDDATSSDSCQGTPTPSAYTKTKDVEVETSVFRAEKYFKMKNEGSPRIIDTINLSKNFPVGDIQADLHKMTSEGLIGSPSVSSVSSWKSRKALLQSSVYETKQKKENGRWYYPGFTCNDSCFQVRSVYTDSSAVARKWLNRKEDIEAVGNRMTLDAGKHGNPRLKLQVNHHEVCNSSPEEMSTIGPAVSTVRSLIDKVEICKENSFGSDVVKEEDNLDGNLSVLSWDSIQNVESKSTRRGNQVYEDIGSDASSDLFEIENISETAQPRVFEKLAPYTMSAACLTSKSMYIPSTGTTNDAAASSSDSGHSKTRSSLSSAGKNKSSGFLSCKNQKAVGISETVRKIKGKATQRLKQAKQ